jgi:hypothetical protein
MSKRRRLTKLPDWTKNARRWMGEKWAGCRYGVGASVGLGVGARVGTEFGV